MFARAIVDHQSSQKVAQKPAESAIQKPLDFGGVKRKALDVIEGTNKRAAVESVSTREVRLKTETVKDHGSNLIAALSTSDAFGETTGKIILDGEAFDEADFDDISFDNWDTPAQPAPVQTVTKTIEQVSTGIKSNFAAIQKEDDYFNDDDDMDWEATLIPTSMKDVNAPELPTALKSSPPIGTPVSTMPPPLTVANSLSPTQEKENKFPPPGPQPAEPTAAAPLSKVLFPSSSDPLPWSSSPVQPKQPRKRTLPWLANPNRYGAPEQATNQYRKQIKSVVHTTNGARAHSTMAMESPSVDWDVLGLTEKDIFESKKLERLDELKRKAEEAKRGMEWIDQAPSAPAPATRRRKRTEEGTKSQKEQNKLVGDRKPLAKVFLSQEQLSVRKLVVEDKMSVFFTGSAGTGKSVLLREIITALKKTYERNPESVAVTASTGLAACNVGGVTLHSFAGFGLGKEEVDILVKKIKKNKKAHERWRRTKVLIVDEISMVDGAFFDKLEKLARILRRNERPFGGMQLVITGDFFQLPPVPDSGREARFAFEAETWTRCIPHTIKLTSVFRQKDQDFVTMLNEMRTGSLSQDSIAKFKALQRPTHFDDNIEPTELFPTRHEVDNANNARMKSLPGPTHTFHAEEGGSITNLQQREKLLGNCMAPKILELRKDAQVMLIKNTDENLVNGSLGKVIGFMSETTYSLCQNEGIEPESALNLDSKADDPFGFKTLEDEEEDSESVRRKKRRILKLRAMSMETSQLWPLVRFTTATGLHIDRLCPREKWSFEQPDGEIQAYRKQVPLILAYAISIHKAQGQTLSRVRVDLGKVFEKGQAYVALSRATSREGLQILRFDARKVMAHPKVAGFYRSLENVSNVVHKAEVKEEKNKGWNARVLEELLERDDEFAETSSYAYG